MNALQKGSTPMRQMICYWNYSKDKTPTKAKTSLQKYLAMRFFSAPEGIRTPGTWHRRTTTRRYRPTLKREFCWFCTAAPETRKSPLVVVTTGFSSALQTHCTVVVKNLVEYQCIIEEADFTEWDWYMNHLLNPLAPLATTPPSMILWFCTDISTLRIKSRKILCYRVRIFRLFISHPIQFHSSDA